MPTGATWVEDGGFDIHNHVVREEAAPRGQVAGEKGRAAGRWSGRLAVEPLDPKRARCGRCIWWRTTVTRTVKPACVLIVRIHHCIADGIALIAVTMSLVDGGAEPPVRVHTGSPAESVEDWIAHATWSSPLTHIAVKALDAAGDGAAASLHLLARARQGGQRLGGPGQGLPTTCSATPRHWL
jgi:diacylglycerol O-acyltransferase